MSLSRAVISLEPVVLACVGGLLGSVGGVAILLHNPGLMFVFAVASLAWAPFLIPWERVVQPRAGAAGEAWVEVKRTLVFEISIEEAESGGGMGLIDADGASVAPPRVSDTLVPPLQGHGGSARVAGVAARKSRGPPRLRRFAGRNERPRAV